MTLGEYRNRSRGPDCSRAILAFPSARGPVAQLGARVNRTHEVRGSNPLGSTFASDQLMNSGPARAAVLVVAVPPHTGLVATEWCAVEPLIHTPQTVYPALIRRVGVVHNAVLEHKCAHAGPFAPIRRPVCPDARGERSDERIILGALRYP